MNKKIYIGYELIKAIADKEIEVGTRFKDKFDNEYIYKYCDLEDNYASLFILDGEQEYTPDYSMFVDNGFEVLEDNTEEIEELNKGDFYNDKARDKINELVRAVNSIRKDKSND